MAGHVERLAWLALPIVLAIGATAKAAPEAASPDAACRDYGSLADHAPISLGRVAAKATRTNFVKDSDDDKTCPAATAACRAKAFVVPGDLVILGRTRGAFVCADYVGAKGQERTGWLPVDAVAANGGPPPTAADWTGTWTRVEATIVVTPAGKPGVITVKGDATWGGLDPNRVKRGAVNLGDIEGIVSPVGADVAFTMSFADGKETTLAVDKGDDFDCKVWMKRLGPWLLVDDNNKCGGMNVTFRGTYVRGK